MSRAGLVISTLILFGMYIAFVKHDIAPQRVLPMLQTDKKDFLLCIGNGRIINANLCDWCVVQNEEQAIECFNRIGGTQK